MPIGKAILRPILKNIEGRLFRKRSFGLSMILIRISIGPCSPLRYNIEMIMQNSVKSR